jgi:DNA-directed RNA polymerase sigma subunit (sigma70/sigma32)
MDELIRTTGARDRSEVERAIASRLSLREQDVIVRRYGLTTGRVETLSSIARQSGVSLERIRQVEAKAILRLAGRRKAVSAEGMR